MSFLNNRFMDGLGRLADMVILSILWMLACVPVITAVPATIALYYATVKAVRRQSGYPAEDFFKGLRRNLKQGLAAGGIGLLLALLLYTLYDFAKAVGLSAPLGGFYFVFVCIAGLSLLCVAFYLLPVLSRFEIRLLNGVKLAIYLCARNLFTMIPLLFTLLGAGVLAYLFPPSMLILPSAYCFLMSFSVEKALKGYMKEHMDNVAEYENMWVMDE